MTDLAPMHRIDPISLTDASDWSRYVYIVHEIGHTFCVKIGKCANPKTRLFALQGGNPRRLRIYAAWNTTAVNALHVERAAQREFSDNRIGGEWFAIHAGVASKYISQFEAPGKIPWECRGRYA